MSLFSQAPADIPGKLSEASNEIRKMSDARAQPAR
jgi:hypothetical protein